MSLDVTQSLDEMCNQISSTFGAAQKNKVWTGCINGNHPLLMELEGVEFNLHDIKEEQLQSLSMVPSAYGDYKSRVMDTSVRVSSELKFQKTVIPTIIQEIGQHLTSSVLGSEFFSLPYKLLYYPKGGFFDWHRDTVEKNLFYTLVVVFPTNESSEGGDLELEGFDAISSKPISNKKIKYFIFDINQPHRVCRVLEGFRCSATWKIYKSSISNSVVKYDQSPNNSKLKSLFSRISQPNILIAVDRIVKITELLTNFIIVYADTKDPVTVYSETEDFSVSSSYREFDDWVRNSPTYEVYHKIDLGPIYTHCEPYTRTYGYRGNSPCTSDEEISYYTFILLNPVPDNVANIAQSNSVE